MAEATDGGQRQQCVVLDTSVLLNFLKVDRLDLLVDLPGHAFLVTDHVRREVTEPIHASALGAALAESKLHEVRVDDPEELATFGLLARTNVLGVGECAALALATGRGFVAAIDDKVARKKATTLLGFDRYLGTADLMVIAIRGGLIGVEAADEVKRLWQEQHRFRLGFTSFAEVL